MNNQELDKIIDKVKKCLALANNPNENEAQLAAQKAHELLIKYNLTMQQVSTKSEYEERQVDEKIFRKAVEKYVDDILQQYFFVKVIISRVRNNRYGTNMDVASWRNSCIMLVGTKANVEIASYVRMFLINTFQDLWKDYKRRTSAPPREEQPYYLGLHNGLCDKLRKQTKRVENEMGLVVVSDPRLEERVAKIPKSKHKRAHFDEEAYAEGIEDGKKIEIRRGIKADSSESGKFIQG